MKILKAILVSTLLFGVGSTLVFNQCTFNKYEKEIRIIDSLRSSLDSMEERFNNIDTARPMKIKREVEEEMETFKKHFQKDTMGEELFSVLTSYKEVEEVAESYEKLYTRIDKGINLTQQQLSDLKADLEKGAYDPKKASSYVEDESRAVENLREKVEILEKKSRKVIENFEKRKGSLKEYLPDSIPSEGTPS